MSHHHHHHHRHGNKVSLYSPPHRNLSEQATDCIVLWPGRRETNGFVVLHKDASGLLKQQPSGLLCGEHILLQTLPGRRKHSEPNTNGSRRRANCTQRPIADAESAVCDLSQPGLVNEEEQAVCESGGH